MEREDGDVLGFTGSGLIFPLRKSSIRMANGKRLGLRNYRDREGGISYTLTDLALAGALPRLAAAGVIFQVSPWIRPLWQKPDLETGGRHRLCGRHTLTVPGQAVLGMRHSMRFLSESVYRGPCLETDTIDVKVEGILTSIAAGRAFGEEEELFVEPHITFMIRGGALLERLLLEPLGV